MSDDERRDSLADQAAAWIPPWERPTPPREPTPDPATPASAPDERPEPEILESYRSPGTETRQDLATDPAAPVPSAGSPVDAQPDSDGGPAAPAAVGAQPAGGPHSAVTSGAEPSDAGVTDAAARSSALPATDADVTDADPDGAAPAGDVPAADGAAGVPPKRARRRVTPAPEPAPVLDDAELRGALEAILLVVDEPVSELTLAQVLEQSPERIGPVLDEIAAGYTAAGHGFELRRAAGGWRLYTRPEYATYVERFVLDGQSVRLTQAALETLAVIAYRQPVTRSRIAAIRGVNSDGVIRTLVSRGLVEECGAEPDSGAFLYRTTTMFLEKLGLNSVADLPPLAPFLPDDVEELADATR
ncbi:SMC-Scp complex subunit ScpB [Micromonospora coxensis]|uniref:SMC-Scp complex subunit ScpB n=1 Tax=Micromonospora coxensis TaxID=356852 RepID=UPI003437C816